MSEQFSKIRTVQGDSKIAQEQQMLAELLRAATADYITSSADYRHAMSMLITALPMYAGHLFGTLLFTGDIDPSSQARMAKGTAQNFREGVKIGLGAAARHAEKTGFLGVKQ